MPFSCRLLPLRVPDELPKSMGSVHKHPIVVSQPCFQGSLLFVIHLFRHCVPEWPAVKIVLQRSGGAVVCLGVPEDLLRCGQRHKKR